MPPYAGPSHPARLGDAEGTLRLLAYLALAATLIVLDHRGGWARSLREQAGVVVEPLRAAAGLPARAIGGMTDTVGTVSQLAQRNRELRRELLLAQARMARMSTVIADNARLRTLLDAAQRGSLDVQLAPILDVDLDPTRQRLVLDAGRRDGVRVGQSVIDAQGLLGQVTHVGPLHSDVLLLTDPDHAVPVAIARNGVRLVAYGTGRSDELALASIPLSSDVKVGDVVVTSGMGGRFPPGFPVGRVTALRPDETRAFLRGDVRPAAQIDRGREVLLLRAAPARPPVVISAPAPSGPVGIEGGLPAATPAGAPATPGLPGAAPPSAAPGAGMSPGSPNAVSPNAVTPAGTAPGSTPPSGVRAGVPATTSAVAAPTSVPGATPSTASPARSTTPARRTPAAATAPPGGGTR